MYHESLGITKYYTHPLTFFLQNQLRVCLRGCASFKIKNMFRQAQHDRKPLVSDQRDYEAKLNFRNNV